MHPYWNHKYLKILAIVMTNLIINQINNKNLKKEF